MSRQKKTENTSTLCGMRIRHTETRRIELEKNGILSKTSIDIECSDHIDL